MPPSDKAIKALWPTTQSLDLVAGPADVVARAICEEFTRFAGEPAILGSYECTDFQNALEPVSLFYNVPTCMIVLPTRSKWSVLWHNSFLCDGYDSLCWCLTSNHGLTTIHWSSHDEWTTFQSGSSFCHRRFERGQILERSVQAAQTDARWNFYQFGEPLLEEDIEGYGVKRKRDRLNEQRLMELLARLGARPWSSDFYDLPGTAHIISRNALPTMIKRDRASVLT